MMTTFTLDSKDRSLTPEEETMLKALDSRAAAPDEDCPEMTQEQFERYSRILAERRAGRRQQVISLRLNEETITKAKRLGSGYTGVLGRIIEYGLSHPEILEQCL